MKIPSTSAGCEPKNLGSRGENITPRPLTSTIFFYTKGTFSETGTDPIRTKEKTDYNAELLLCGIDGRSLWLNYLLPDLSLLSVCGIFRSGFSGSQMNNLSGGTAVQTDCSSDCQRKLLLKMPHTDGGETSSRR